MITSLAVGAALSCVVAGLAFRLRALTRTGAVAACVVGAPIVAAGIGWAALLFLFFATSSTLSRSAPVSRLTAKEGRRDATQVLANGGVPLVASLLYLSGARSVAPMLFAGSLAAATADTWATEIGLRSRGLPRHIITGRPVTPGTSGGVTMLGVMGALGGALLIAASAPVVGVIPWQALPAVALAGLGGAVVDSLLGATVQESRYCPLCGEATEQRLHAVCGSRTRRIRGVAGIDNDTVNLLAALAAGLAAVALTR